MVSLGVLTVGALAAFQAIFLTTSYALATVSQFVPTAVEALGGLLRVEEVFEHPPRMAAEGRECVPEPWGEIRFENVSFGYSSGQRNVQGVDLTIGQWQSVAIVGSSGSGKSTFLSLLMRLYDPDEGSITIGRTDLRRIPAADLRSRMGYVPQAPPCAQIS